MDESGKASEVPKRVTMPAFTGDECEKTDSRFVYEKIVSNRTFCAGNRDGEFSKVFLFVLSKCKLELN
jgi:hypothetical protein